MPGSTADIPKIISTSTDIEMVSIPAGRFAMGSCHGEPDEAPVHEVWIDAFLMDRCEMTQEHFAELARGNPWLTASPSHFKGPHRPVEMTGWDIAALLCNERSRKEGLVPCYDEETGQCNFLADGYRLPTEAEWEYACRAGNQANFSFGSDARLLGHHAWYADNAGKKTHPVGQKKPNAWGLFDMHGNVAEWCNDVYHEHFYNASPTKNPRGPMEGDHYVLRGGAWNCSADACRSARRVGEDAGFADACFARDAVGFRCVRRLPAQAAAKEDPGESAVDDDATNIERRDGAEEDAANDPPPRKEILYGDVGPQHRTGLVKQIAQHSDQGQLVSVLEGGDDLLGLGVSVEAHLRVLMD